MSDTIPAGWSEERIDNLCSVDNESLTEKTSADFQFRYIDISRVSTGVIDYPNEKICFSNAPSRARRVVKNGDVLVSTVRPNLKAFAYFSRPGDDWIASTGFSVLRATKNSDGKFLLYIMISDDVSSQIEKHVSGSNYPAINSSELKSLTCIVPPLNEQQKIAEILTSVDEVIENTQSQIDKLEDLKKATMNELLTKGIGHTEFKETEIGTVPKSWSIAKVVEHTEKIFDFRGKTPLKIGMDWGKGNILALSANNVKNGYIDLNAETKFASESLYKKWMTNGDLIKNDVLVTMEAPLGNIALVPDDKRYVLSQRVVALRFNDLLIPDYILHYMQSSVFQQQLNKQSTGTTAVGIQQKRLLQLCLSIPSKQEQEVVSTILGSINAQINLTRTALRKKENLKLSLMQDLLTGKVRVKVD